MTNLLKLVQSLDAPTAPKPIPPLKSRRQHRQEQRDRLKGSKLIQKKNDRLSA